MTIERWTEIIFGTLALVGTVIVWAFSIDSRLRILETSYREHVQSKKESIQMLTTHLMRLESKVDHIALRCASFQALHKMPVENLTEEDETG